MSPCLITADPTKRLSFPPCSTPSDIERGYKQFFHVMPCLSVVSIPRRTGGKPYRKHSLILPWEVSTPVQFAVLLRHWREKKNGSNWILREETGVNSSNRNFRVACLKNAVSLILEINKYFKRSSIGFSGLFAWHVSKRAAYLGKSMCCQVGSEEVRSYWHQSCTADTQPRSQALHCTAAPIHNPGEVSWGWVCRGENRDHHCS